MRFALIPFLLLVVPLAEIGAFIVIGGEIGVAATLALVLATAVLGSILLRVQGFGLLTRIRSEMDAGRLPGRELVHGALILLAGVLLLTPGFVTDALGFLLFVPPIRDAIWSFAKGRIVIVAPGQPTPPRRDAPGTIDLDPDDYSSSSDPRSPWRDGPPPDG